MKLLEEASGFKEHVACKCFNSTKILRHGLEAIRVVIRIEVKFLEQFLYFGGAMNETVNW